MRPDSDNGFGPGLLPREGLNGANHLVVGFPLVLEMASARIINVVLFGNAVQPVDTGIHALQAFLQMRAWAHVLVPKPMEFDARFGQPFLHVPSPTNHATTAAAVMAQRAAESSSPCHRGCA